MLKFFRKVRQKLLLKGETGRYLKYAIGEIILVVIGILIALQINNWNEKRKSDIKESVLVKNIIEDLRLDSVHINKSLKEVANQIFIVDELIAKALGSELKLNFDSTGLVRYSSDFRPISQRNHAESVSGLEDESIREILQNYFLKEDDVMDIFMEYENIIFDKIRPYLSNTGMHNLKSLYEEEDDDKVAVLLKPAILLEQLKNVTFQQLLFERRLKTGEFETLLTELEMKNKELIQILTIGNN